MDREELVERIDDQLPVDGNRLNRDKILKQDRYLCIQEEEDYIRFDIERHPGAGPSHPGDPYTTLQTWRYDKETSRLQRVCEFARWHIDTIEQATTGEPRCRHCGAELDLFEELFGFSWRCPTCGAVGGKEEEAFAPSFGEGLVDRAEYEEIEEGLWIPRGTE